MKSTTNWICIQICFTKKIGIVHLKPWLCIMETVKGVSICSSDENPIDKITGIQCKLQVLSETVWVTAEKICTWTAWRCRYGYSSDIPIRRGRSKMIKNEQGKDITTWVTIYWSIAILHTSDSSTTVMRICWVDIDLSMGSWHKKGWSDFCHRGWYVRKINHIATRRSRTTPGIGRLTANTKCCKENRTMK